MATLKKHLGWLTICLMGIAVFGCNDGRVPIKKVAARINQSLPPQSLIEIADIKFQGADMNVWTMANKGSSIYVTGTPFGFAKWDVTSNPENPQLTFSVSNQIDRLFPKWVAPWYANGALAILGKNAFMSGEVGASVIDMTETSRPKEVKRYPPYDENTDDVTADEAYIWSAASFHPSGQYMYAFRQEDFVLTYQVSGPNLSLKSKDAYADENTCCVNASTVFNNHLYVAFRSRLLAFDFGGNGALTNLREFDGLQATYVTSTSRYLYVAYEPTYGGTSSQPVYPAGVYVFDKSGENVAFLQASPILFAVNENDTHMYAKLDDASVRIYRIQWTR